MAEIRANPTRMEQKRLERRYTTARRGHKLLKDKRDGLMKRFLEVAEEDRALRERVEERLEAFYRSFAVARASSFRYMLEEALVCPRTEACLSVSYQNVMGVTVPQFEMSLSEHGEGEIFPYGFAFTSGELDASLGELGELLRDILRMAELEKTVQLLAEEIERTRRRVNALEYSMMPRYLATIKAIKMKLDENERASTARLMKVKDRMVKERLAKGKGDEEET